MFSHIYLFFFYALSLTCFILEFRKGWIPSTYNLVSRLHTSWLNFLILIWVLLIIGLIGSSLFTFISKNVSFIQQLPEGTQSILRGYCVQGLLLVTLIIFLLKLSQLIGDIGLHRFSLRKTLLQGPLGFFSGFPLIWISFIIWEQILSWLHNLGIMHKPTPQNLVTYLLETHSIPVLIAALVLSIFIAPIIEEIIFRGILYRFLKGQFSMNMASIGSSLIFALIHYNILTFVPLLIVGMLLVRTYEKTGDIKASILFHALFNFNTFILITIQSPTL